MSIKDEHDMGGKGLKGMMNRKFFGKPAKKGKKIAKKKKPTDDEGDHEYRF